MTANTLRRGDLKESLMLDPNLEELTLNIVDVWAGVLRDLTLPSYIPLDSSPENGINNRLSSSRRNNALSTVTLCPNLKSITIAWLSEVACKDVIINLILSRWNSAGSLTPTANSSLRETGVRALEAVRLRHCEQAYEVSNDARIRKCVEEGLVLLIEEARNDVSEYCGLKSLKGIEI